MRYQALNYRPTNAKLTDSQPAACFLVQWVTSASWCNGLQVAGWIQFQAGGSGYFGHTTRLLVIMVPVDLK